MKKLFLYIVISTLGISSFCQSCLSDGIHFKTQTQIDSFQINYPNCTEIEGSVWISLLLSDTTHNLHGLSSLTKIGKDLSIGTSQNSNNIDLTKPDIDRSDYAYGTHQSVNYLDSTFSLSLEGLEMLDTIIGDLRLTGYIKSLADLKNLNFVGETINLQHTTLTDLSGLDKIPKINKDLTLFGNRFLVNIEGLEGVSHINGNVRINANVELNSLDGLNHLIYIGGFLALAENRNLKNVNGLEKLSTVKGSLALGFYSDYEIWRSYLKNVEGFTNLSFVGGEIRISYNDSLTSLNGLENIQSQSIDNLYIAHNNLLESCSIESICEYIASPDASVIIYKNATGCYDKDEVTEECGLSIRERVNFDVNIYPNPASDKLKITSNNGVKLEMINIYNQLGQIILNSDEIGGNIDISMLVQGIYIIEVISNEFKINRRLLIKE